MPAVPRVAAWVALAVIFSGKASTVFWLLLSFLDQDWPVAFVCSTSQACVLAGYPPVQSLTTASCCEHSGLHLHSCAWNAQQFMEGWEGAASLKSKMWLWSGLFYCFFLLHLKIFKGLSSSLESCLIPIACMLQGSQLSVWWLPTPLDMPSALWPLTRL